MKNLTKRQSEIFNYIKTEIENNGYPPTRSEISKTFGFKSPNAAEDHLKALKKKGVLDLAAGTSRGITIASESSGIPVVGLVSAGGPILAEENIERTINCPKSFFESGFDYFLKVRGLSMKDAGIMEDDLIAVKKTTDVKNGDIVIARLDDEVTVKFFNRKSSNIVELEPANEDFENIVINLESEQLHIEGKSVGLLRRN